MAYTTVPKSTDYFNTKLYTGTGSSNAITGVGFQPDFVWQKSRSAAEYHGLFDAVRGVTKRLRSAATAAESTQAGSLTAFGSDGFTVGGSPNNDAANGNGQTFVSWNWKANGQGSSNTDGSINTTYTSASTTSGFSIVQYTGTGANATVGHGLGKVPKTIFVKDLSASNAWRVYTEATGNTSQGELNDGTSFDSGNTSMWNSTTPTATLFSIGTHGSVNTSGRDYIAYCFADVQGYSKVGSFTGNGNADGPFVYTGFKPAFVMIKNTATNSSWYMYDNKRPSVYNPNATVLFANTTEAEITNTASGEHPIDFLSNGFKIKTTSSARNGDGNKIWFIAYAEEPLVSTNGNAATAR